MSRVAVELEQDVVNFVRFLPPQPRQALWRALKNLQLEQGDIRALEGDLEGFYRFEAASSHPTRITFAADFSLFTFHFSPLTLSCHPGTVPKEVTNMPSLPDFRLETYLARWEFAARFHMTASDAESMSLSDLLRLAEPADREAFEHLWLGYVPTFGGEAFRNTVASAYASVSPDNVLAFAGGGEAIYVALHALLGPGDHAIVVTPTYQSLETVTLSLCAATGIALDGDNGWKLDLDEVRDQVRPNTKLIAVNFPNNPTGRLLSAAEFDELIKICREHGLWLLSDEVYRLIERSPSLRLPAAVDHYERGLSISVVSKVYGLPGLRIGWIAAQHHDLLERMERIKHYLSICNSGPGEALAVIALKAREQILDRNLALINANLKCVGEFFTDFPDLFEWETPDAGTVGYPRYKGADGIETFARRLVEEANVLLLPASIFWSELTPLPEDRFRIGYGRSYVPAGLEAMRGWLARR